MVLNDLWERSSDESKTKIFLQVMSKMITNKINLQLISIFCRKYKSYKGILSKSNLNAEKNKNKKIKLKIQTNSF